MIAARSISSGWPLLFLALAALVIALFLFPVDADGAFASQDGVATGIAAERFPLHSISPHHPLFHVLVFGFMAPLQALGVANPGHIAARAVSGLGAAWLLLQICLMAGVARARIGFAFALVVMCSRMFVIEAAVGENVLPAAAAALWALRLSSRTESRLKTTGAALVLALLLRQDNILIVPAVALCAFWAHRSDGWKPVSRMLLSSGIATAIGYVVLWLVTTNGSTRLDHYLLTVGRKGPWDGAQSADLVTHIAIQLPKYFESLSDALLGRLTLGSSVNVGAGPIAIQFPTIALGVALLGVVVVAGILIRGDRPHLLFCVGAAVTLALRCLFHTWFEATNPEWLMLPIALVTASAAGLVRGTRTTSAGSQGAGLALLAAVLLTLILSHGRSTIELRERRLMSALVEATDVDQSRWRFLVHGPVVEIAMQWLEIPAVALPHDPQAAFAKVQELMAADPVPTIVIFDRFVMNGMPVVRNVHVLQPWFVDAMSPPPGMQFLKRDSRVFSIRITP